MRHKGTTFMTKRQSTADFYAGIAAASAGSRNDKVVRSSTSAWMTRRDLQLSKDIRGTLLVEKSAMTIIGKGQDFLPEPWQKLNKGHRSDNLQRRCRTTNQIQNHMAKNPSGKPYHHEEGASFIMPARSKFRAFKYAEFNN